MEKESGSNIISKEEQVIRKKEEIVRLNQEILELKSELASLLELINELPDDEEKFEEAKEKNNTDKNKLVPVKFFSIPALSNKSDNISPGKFDMEYSSNTEGANHYYCIDSENNLCITKNLSIRRAIENIENYLLPACEIVNFKERITAKGIEVLELGKINNNGKIIKKIKIKLINEQKVVYPGEDGKIEKSENKIEGDYEKQKAEIERRRREAKKVHEESVLTAADNGFVIKKSKNSYSVAKDLRSLIQKEPNSDSLGVTYKYKTDNNIYHVVISTYDKKRGAGVGYVGYSIKIDGDTVLTDEEIYSILEKNLNGVFEQNFIDKNNWTTDPKRSIDDINKVNDYIIIEKYDAELAELDKKFNKKEDDAIENPKKEDRAEKSEVVEKSENKIEGDYETIGYADVILSGELKPKYISNSPREDTVFEILKDKNGNIKLGVWSGAEKRVLKNPDFVDGAEKSRLALKPNKVEVKLGELRKNENGGYTISKPPEILFKD